MFVHCKDTNLKAIHNYLQDNVFVFRLFVHCKDTNLKAIHNTKTTMVQVQTVVRALQRY